MPKFIIERDINDAGSLTTDELQEFHKNHARY